MRHRIFIPVGGSATDASLTARSPTKTADINETMTRMAVNRSTAAWAAGVHNKAVNTSSPNSGATSSATVNQERQRADWSPASRFRASDCTGSATTPATPTRRKVMSDESMPRGMPKRAIPGRRFARTEHLVVVSCSRCGGQSQRLAAARREQRWPQGLRGRAQGRCRTSPHTMKRPRRCIATTAGACTSTQVSKSTVLNSRSRAGGPQIAEPNAR